MAELNATHDPSRRSWVASANEGKTDFPIQNLPLGVFRAGGEPRAGMAIGDRIFDIAAARHGHERCFAFRIPGIGIGACLEQRPPRKGMVFVFAMRHFRGVPRSGNVSTADGTARNLSPRGAAREF